MLSLSSADFLKLTFSNNLSGNYQSRDFPRPDLGPNNSLSSPIQKMSKNFPKIVYIIPNFLVLHFDENFNKIRTKYQLQMYENLHKNVNKNMFSFIHRFYAIFKEFYGGKLKQQICYSFTLLISYMAFNPFKMAVKFF